MNGNIDAPHKPERKEYKFLWMKLKKPARKEIYHNLFNLTALALAACMAILFPRKNCTCEDQVTDLRLETLARQGNKQVMHYQQERESVITCAAKREELLRKLEKEKKRRSNKENKPD